MDVINSFTLKTLLVLKQNVTWLRKASTQQRSSNYEASSHNQFR